MQRVASGDDPVPRRHARCTRGHEQVRKDHGRRGREARRGAGGCSEDLSARRLERRRAKGFYPAGRAGKAGEAAVTKGYRLIRTAGNGVWRVATKGGEAAVNQETRDKIEQTQKHGMETHHDRL